MVTIRAISISKKKNYCLIDIDDGSSIEIHVDLVGKHHLTKGLSISDELLNQIVFENEIINVKRAAISYISYKPRTSKQVKDKLRLKGFQTEHIQIAIDFLNDFGYLNDGQTASALTDSVLKRKNVSKNYLTSKLANLGIDKDSAREIVESKMQPDDEIQSAKALAQKKIDSLKLRFKEKRQIKEKVIRHLSQKGFPYSTIKCVVAELFEDDELFPQV